tara:strand:+ start:613 stop:2952 length:2340 start_codon:yes stop_codon:yes gene_type:complete
MSDKLTEQELLEAQILADPVYFAEMYLKSPANPKEDLVLRPYQKEILRDRTQKRVLRMGRRTGKTVTLAIEAIWKAYTHTNREVLLVAGYDSQVQTIFNLIFRMARDATFISTSIERTRMRPYEIWFKNGSVIMGYVGNNAVRGKCFPPTTNVVMWDRTLKTIKDLEINDEVLSVDTDSKDGLAVKGVVTAVHDNGVKDIYSIETTSERVVHATENHKFMLLYRGWTEIKDMNTQEKKENLADFVSIIHPDGKAYWSRVKTIKKIGKSRTYDVTIDKYHDLVVFNEVEGSAKGVAVGVNVTSGQKVTGGHTGGFLAHNSANDLYIDEVDSIPFNSLIEAVIPIETTYKDTTLTVSGTPTGRREYFYNVSMNKDELNFGEHHFPSMVSPEWSPQREKELKVITPMSQFEHEYLAEFGSSADGVFKNHHIDPNLYVYNYSDLKYNPKNKYILGVDWNESQFGVQAVILEYLVQPEEVIPFNDGDWKKEDGTIVNPVVKQNALRVFYADNIDGAEFTNVGAVEFIIKLMKKFHFTKLVFDRGHGEANYEMLRVAIKNGKGPLGTDAFGLSEYLQGDKMVSLDMGGSSEVIDPVSGTTTKALTKNVMVKNSQLMNEEGRYIIPAVDKQGQTVENDELNLVGQMRGYVVARYGKTGEIYESTVRDGLDHRLDAFMLATHGYTLLSNDFYRWESDLVAEQSETILTANVKPGWRSDLKDQKVPSVENGNGITIYRHGDYSSPGEPGEYVRDKDGNLKKYGEKQQARSSRFKHTERTLIKKPKRRF